MASVSSSDFDPTSEEFQEFIQDALESAGLGGPKVIGVVRTDAIPRASAVVRALAAVFLFGNVLALQVLIILGLLLAIRAL